MRRAQNTKRSKAKSPEQVRKNEALIIEAHQAYLSVAQDYLEKARQSLAVIERQGLANAFASGEENTNRRLHGPRRTPNRPNPPTRHSG